MNSELFIDVLTQIMG